MMIANRLVEEACSMVSGTSGEEETVARRLGWVERAALRVLQIVK